MKQQCMKLFRKWMGPSTFIQTFPLIFAKSKYKIWKYISHPHQLMLRASLWFNGKLLSSWTWTPGPIHSQCFVRCEVAGLVEVVTVFVTLLTNFCHHLYTVTLDTMYKGIFKPFQINFLISMIAGKCLFCTLYSKNNIIHFCLADVE